MLQENIVQEGEKQRLRPCSHTSLRPPFPLPFFFSPPLFSFFGPHSPGPFNFAPRP
jgi:hypothetical protein